jgi:GMP synthase (glutamine-hydrolysing)
MDDHDAAIIFGGPMSANDDTTLPFIKAELNWIPVVLKEEKPFLGICLGAQLLARVLGATVAPHTDGTVEIGYFPLQATEHGNGIMDGLSYVYHWHKEGFDLPRSATLLATGDTFPHQAYRYGQRTYGLQFHPEINQPMMEFWTTKGAEQLTQQGAQPRDKHFQSHERYSPQVESWLHNFLADWLSP